MSGAGGLGGRREQGVEIVIVIPNSFLGVGGARGAAVVEGRGSFGTHVCGSAD